jgi:hypothetical protein
MSVAISFQSNLVPTHCLSLTGKEAKMDIDQLRHIELAVGKHLDKKELAGAVTLVLRKGGIVHLEAHGWKDLASRTPMTTDTIFRIFSMTKPIVSVGVMMLVEEGKIELDDPIEKHLHQLKGLKYSRMEKGSPPTVPPQSVIYYDTRQDLPMVSLAIQKSINFMSKQGLYPKATIRRPSSRKLARFPLHIIPVKNGFTASQWTCKEP